MRVVGGVLLLVVIVYVCPLILSRILSVGVVKRAAAANAIAWTFDDGPHPEDTPRLLALLEAYQVKATFFVVGDHARKHPELLKAIAEGGHEIGLHNPVHWPNWLFTPWRLRRELDCMAEAIEAVTGQRPVCYRPPWGVLTLFDYFFLRPYRLVLWSFNPKDWSHKTTAAQLKAALLTRVRPGDIILLHDSGDTFAADPAAPLKTAAVLADVFEAMRDRGYAHLTVSQLIERQRASLSLPRWKRLLIFLFMRYDRLYRRLNGVTHFHRRDDFLHGHVKAYRGPSRVLSDGTTLQRGDPILNLHFNNELMFQLAKEAVHPMQLAVQLVRRATAFLPVLAQHLEQDPQYREVKALYGISLIHRGTRAFGFEALDLPTGFSRWVTHVYLRLLLAVIHPEGQVSVTGIPIHPAFSRSYSRAELRLQFGFNPAVPTVLVMGGSWGLIEDGVEIFRRLSQRSQAWQVFFVCGKNQQLWESLMKEKRQLNARAIVTPFIENIHEVMAASDLIITKPGGMTTTEAVALEVPMLLYKPLPGQEEDNARFLLHRGVAKQATDVRDVVAQAEVLLANPETLDAMRERARRLPFKRSSVAASDAIMALASAEGTGSRL